MCKKIATIYEDEDFRIQGELLDEHFFVHVETYNYSKSVKKKMDSVWEDIKEEVWMNGWDFVFSYNTNTKFAELFGGKKVEGVVGMYTWALK